MITVRADIIDIRRDTPQASDVLLVDTNVWYWVGYENNQTARAAAYAEAYSDYFLQGMAHGAAYVYYPLSLPELSHSIERNEWQRLMDASQQPDLSFKDFRRHYVQERYATWSLINDAWTLVVNVCNDDYLPVMMDNTSAVPFLGDFINAPLDGYDLLMLHAMQTASITQLLTDDADFGQVPAIQVFTANPYLIQQATQQGRLIARPTE